MMEVPALAVWVAARRIMSGLSSGPGRSPGCRMGGTGRHAYGQPASPHRAVQLDRLSCISRAGGHEMARRGATGAKRLVSPQQEQQQARAARLGLAWTAAHRAPAWLARLHRFDHSCPQLLERQVTNSLVNGHEVSPGGALTPSPRPRPPANGGGSDCARLRSPPYGAPRRRPAVLLRLCLQVGTVPSPAPTRPVASSGAARRKPRGHGPGVGACHAAGRQELATRCPLSSGFGRAARDSSRQPDPPAATARLS